MAQAATASSHAFDLLTANVREPQCHQSAQQADMVVASSPKSQLCGLQSSIQKHVSSLQQPLSHPEPEPVASVVFVFPLASGHLNPSLALARQMVARGLAVHYLADPELKDPIAATGASFNSAADWEPEFFGEGAAKGGSLQALMKHMDEYNLLTEFPDMLSSGGDFAAFLLLARIAHCKRLPGVIRFLQHVKASGVVYCPLFSSEGMLAARYLQIPAISLLTTAGPGSILEAFPPAQQDWVRQAMHRFKPHHEAVAQLNTTYNFDPPINPVWDPTFVDGYSTDLNLVTTVEELEDQNHPEVKAAMSARGVVFQYMGPFMDSPGAKRSGVHRMMADTHPSGGDDAAKEEVLSDSEVLARVETAKKRGAKVVYASLGTVLTGDMPTAGWNARLSMTVDESTGAQKPSISGKELCQAAWEAVFRRFGREESEESEEWLIVVVTGAQDNPLEGLSVPSNAICVPNAPQMDLLRLGVDIFLTHGGQNSLMESLACGTPVVVCPGFGDQPANAQKAQQIGVGLQVPRMLEGEEKRYCDLVVDALGAVASNRAFSEKAAEVSVRLATSGGVSGAVQAVTNALNIS